MIDVKLKKNRLIFNHPYFFLLQLSQKSLWGCQVSGKEKCCVVKGEAACVHGHLLGLGDPHFHTDDCYKLTFRAHVNMSSLRPTAARIALFSSCHWKKWQWGQQEGLLCLRGLHHHPQEPSWLCHGKVLVWNEKLVSCMFSSFVELGKGKVSSFITVAV